MVLPVQLTLGLIFLVSAAAKLRNPAAFVRGVEEYAVLPRPLARLYGRLLPAIELATALLLLSGGSPRVAAALSVAMLAGFAVALAVNAARGRAIRCHCFGGESGGRVGWHSLFRVVVLLIPASWLLWAETPAEPWALAPAAGVAALAALTWALAAEALEIGAGVRARRGVL